MLFDDIIGNSHIKRYLKKAIDKNALGNSILFSGIEGIGKSLFAKALSIYLMNLTNNDTTAIAKLDDESHPDLHILRPEGKTALHSIASIRGLIEKISLSPYEAKSKVFIIHEAHRMLPSSCNALLKTLEEPNLDSYIILITDKETDLLPTIISRCLKLKFSPLSDNEIISLLERWGKTKAESIRIASFAGGSVSRACEISSYVEDDDKTKILIDILSRNGINNYFDLTSQLDSLQSIFDKQDKKETSNDSVYRFKSIDILFSHIFMWYRDLYLYINNMPHDMLFYSDRIELLKKVSSSKMPPLQVINKYISEAAISIERNIKIKTCLENLFIKLKIV